MSFEDFAKRIASTPEATAGAAARAAELARKPFAEAFVNEVYPHWQGPLKTISPIPRSGRMCPFSSRIST